MSAVLLSLLAGGVATSATVVLAAAADCGTSQQCNVNPPPGFQGTGWAPAAVPRGVQAALNYWRQMSWPNWRNVGQRGAAFQVENYHDQRGNHHEGWIETGGQYQDHGDRLRTFLNIGYGGRAENYQGTFQEYYGSVYPSNPERSHISTGNFRIVRAINTGDVFVSIDHYSTFRYVGRM
ncbi:hypothetical protein [Streptomyces regalis]|uniref:hypothetical protein n=1 Tax=Streptomyces regalis TaxID=68262 RepID=UPI00078976DF|nr:hypothetical protein [Streptomyces regalis]